MPRFRTQLLTLRASFFEAPGCAAVEAGPSYARACTRALLSPSCPFRPPRLRLALLCSRRTGRRRGEGREPRKRTQSGRQRASGRRVTRRITKPHLALTHDEGGRRPPPNRRRCKPVARLAPSERGVGLTVVKEKARRRRPPPSVRRGGGPAHCVGKGLGERSGVLSPGRDPGAQARRTRTTGGRDAANNGGLLPARHRAGLGNDPSAGSPTETLLRLHLPLNDKV